MITMPKRLLTWFFQGLIFVAPLAITAYVSVLVFRMVDGWLGLPIPGAGFVATIALITLVGFLASNLLTRGIVGFVDDAVNRLPFVKLLYSSTRDLLNAFVGEKRRFDAPVLVTLLPGGAVKALGFITRDSLASLGLEEHVAVYLPQSYNFAGQVLVFRSDQVLRLSAPSSDVMAFIVSGGVTTVPQTRAATPLAAPAAG